ncbi:MAG: glycosyltransferase [Phenylobacterium sp.]|uniref:glycosyltransferase family 2 protein n=1 Tax=Phenylobacterium sp. TaxID=1871053 RepID=UPI00121B5477|nr:glycosyltransferase [Phenylobacterium sp.]TAJ70613.1 MAG: glycosyltransferase [Phenylobacterium sp.]
MQTAPEEISARVSVIVPHYHDLPALGLCLSALGRQTYPHPFEIVVADNASPEGREAVAAAIAGRAKLVVVEERGAGPARNGGVAAASGGLLAFTDCDCVPEPDWLSRGLAALERGDLVGGRMTVLLEEAGRPRPAEAFEAVFAFDNERYIREMGFSVTANLFCRKAVFEKVGGFRVGMSEDLEWCQRAGAAGYRIVYEPLAVVGHPARRTWEELRAKWRRLSAETFALTADRPMGSLRWFLRSLLLPVSAVAHTPKVLASPALTSWPQRLGALGVLYRLRFWRLGDALGLLASGGRR